MACVAGVLYSLLCYLPTLAVDIQYPVMLMLQAQFLVDVARSWDRILCRWIFDRSSEPVSASKRCCVSARAILMTLSGAQGVFLNLFKMPRKSYFVLLPLGVLLNCATRASCQCVLACQCGRVVWVVTGRIFRVRADTWQSLVSVTVAPSACRPLG